MKSKAEVTREEHVDFHRWLAAAANTDPSPPATHAALLYPGTLHDNCFHRR